MGLKKGIHVVKQKLNSSVFGWEELMKYSGINGSFVNEKAGNRTFEVPDSTNDALDEEVGYSALLLILIEIVIERVSKVVWIQRIAIVT